MLMAAKIAVPHAGLNPANTFPVSSAKSIHEARMIPMATMTITGTSASVQAIRSSFRVSTS